MKILLVNNFIHKKNKNALNNYNNIQFTTVNNINDCKIEDFDCVYSPGSPINSSNYPNVKFIFGPHFSVFPNYSHISQISNSNSVYVQPSKWVVELWKNNSICNHLNIMSMPFGVDTNKFINNKNINERNKVFIYFKHRNPDELAYIKQMLNNKNIEFTIFNYGSYDEKNYINYLMDAKYGIWIGCHESQGFALQEALSSDVPLLVWNVTSLNQEHGSNYPNYYATSVPYWDNSCGELFEKKEHFESLFNIFLQKIHQYKPREYILKNLSFEVCEKQMMEIVNAINI